MMMMMNDRVIIDPHHHTSLFIKKKEADKLLLQFPNLKNSTDEDTIGWNWTKETQPVIVNYKTPGLITKWRAPFEKGIKSSARRHGKMTLAIINPTENKFKLPKTMKITNYRPARFIKEKGTENSEALFVLRPESLYTISALNKDGMEIQVRRIKATEVEREVIQKADSMYARYVTGENLLVEAFPNREMLEDFPIEDPSRIPDTVREYQAETNRQEEHLTEFMEYPNIKVDGTDIVLTEYSLMGELPISDKSGVFVKTIAHVLASVGCTMHLSTCEESYNLY